jgi:hypothetical protein
MARHMVAWQEMPASSECGPWAMDWVNVQVVHPDIPLENAVTSLRIG